MADDVATLRGEIDACDDELLAALARRAELVRRIGAAKRAAGLPAVDPERERRLVERLQARPDARALGPDGVARIFERIFEVTRRLAAGP